MQIRKITLPDVPPEINLLPNGKVLSDEEIERVKLLIKVEGKYSRKKLACQFPWIYSKGNYYILCLEQYHHREGSYGKIIPAQDATTGEFVAFKKMITAIEQAEGDEEDPNAIFATEHEAEFLADVGLAITNDEGIPVKLSYKSNQYNHTTYLIAMKWLSGDYPSYTDLRHFPFVVTLLTLIQIVNEVRHVHARRILHRDIKVGNLMFDFQKHKVRLIDFGLSRYMSPQNNYKGNGMIVGTEDYIAQELYDPFDPTSSLSQTSRDLMLAEFKQALFSMENPTKEAIHGLLSSVNCYNQQTEMYALGETFRHLIPVKDDASNSTVPENNEKLEKLYKKMVDKVPSQRPSTSDCLQLLTEIQNNLSSRDRTLRVGVIDANELYKLSKQCDWENPEGNYRYAILGRFEDFHKIVLFDQTPHPQMEFHQTLVKDVEGFGCKRIFPQIYCARLNAELIQTMQRDLSLQHPDCLWRFYYFNIDKTADLKTTQYTPGLFQPFRNDTPKYEVTAFRKE